MHHCVTFKQLPSYWCACCVQRGLQSHKVMQMGQEAVLAFCKAQVQEYTLAASPTLCQRQWSGTTSATGARCASANRFMHCSLVLSRCCSNLDDVIAIRTVALLWACFTGLTKEWLYRLRMSTSQKRGLQEGDAPSVLSHLHL